MRKGKKIVRGWGTSQKSWFLEPPTIGKDKERKNLPGEKDPETG